MDVSKGKTVRGYPHLSVGGVIWDHDIANLYPNAVIFGGWARGKRNSDNQADPMVVVLYFPPKYCTPQATHATAGAPTSLHALLADQGRPPQDTAIGSSAAPAPAPGQPRYSVSDFRTWPDPQSKGNHPSNGKMGVPPYGLTLRDVHNNLEMVKFMTYGPLHMSKRAAAAIINRASLYIEPIRVLNDLLFESVKPYTFLRGYPWLMVPY